jgi:Domain of unknown function (DUF5069)
MNIPGLRSPYETVGGLVYFGRMLDKIRLHHSGRLPSDYNLGESECTWFDGRCTRFLGVSYSALSEEVLRGGTDEELLDWCYRTGRHPNEEEILIWNAFMTKRGWRDEASADLLQAKQQLGLAARTDILTYFDLHDADEGRGALNG